MCINQLSVTHDEWVKLSKEAVNTIETVRIILHVDQVFRKFDKYAHTEYLFAWVYS